MSNAPPPSSPSSSGPGLNPFASSSPLQQRAATSHSLHQTTASSIYSFSVHQPYTNWPLHASSSHYPSSWYPVHPQAYGQTKVYKDIQVQTENGEEDSKGATDRDAKAREEEEESGEVEAEKQPYRPRWDVLLRGFLKNAGLFQALRGLKDDMLMMNVDWERDIVPGALREFVKDMTDLLNDGTFAMQSSETLEERKLEYIKPAKSVEAQTPTSLTRSIARFLAQSRHRNDASNREEFLQSIAEKRRRLNNDDTAESTSAPGTEEQAPLPSCARADAKAQDRDVQMKYDIAKNEDGPLKRTIKVKTEEFGMSGNLNAKGKSREVARGSEPDVTEERHPGLAGRLADVEAHLAVRYVPSPPESLMDRLRFLEDHIIKLEQDYPPWAALHFNQPNRGWPPPPRITPIIVPSHLTSSAAPQTPSSSPATSSSSSIRKANTKSNLESPFTSVPFNLPSASGSPKSTGKGSRAKSSLHRAVMEKLEVQRAMGDLAESKYAHVAPGLVMGMEGTSADGATLQFAGRGTLGQSSSGAGAG